MAPLGTFTVCASLVILALALFVCSSEGSCSQFGHSCFGAHGKRSGEEMKGRRPILSGGNFQKNDADVIANWVKALRLAASPNPSFSRRGDGYQSRNSPIDEDY